MFQAFDSFDEMMDAIRQASIQADHHVQPWQTTIQPGDYFFRNTEYGFPIFGKILPPPSGFYHTVAGQHFRYSNCFSVACPLGEHGDIHISEIEFLITEDLFLFMKDEGWSFEFNNKALNN